MVMNELLGVRALNFYFLLDSKQGVGMWLTSQGLLKEPESNFTYLALSRSRIQNFTISRTELVIRISKQKNEAKDMT